MKRKILSILLCLSIIASFMPAVVFAAPANRFIACIYCEDLGSDDSSRNLQLEFDDSGTLTYDFPGVSYVYVRDYDTGTQYCTDGWTNFENPVTLVNENNLTNLFEKMYVPMGEHTLYLSDNGDDTYTLSYDIAPAEKGTSLYYDADKGLDATNLLPGYFNEETQEWEMIPYMLDEENHEAIIITDHFSK